VGDIVEGLVGDAASEGSVAGDRDHVFLATGPVARHRHAKCRGERRAGVSGAVAIVLTLCAQHEPVEAAGSANGIELLLPSGEELVNVGLMADVEEKAVARGIEDVVQGERQFHHAEIRSQVPAIVGEHGDHPFPDLTGELIQFGRREFLDLLGGIYAFKYGCHSSVQSA